MAEQARLETSNRIVLDVPWIQMWENRFDTPKKNIFDEETNSDYIEFMNMLEELEFH